MIERSVSTIQTLAITTSGTAVYKPLLGNTQSTTELIAASALCDRTLGGCYFDILLGLAVL
jgi:hypothetical protein